MLSVFVWCSGGLFAGRARSERVTHGQQTEPVSSTSKFLKSIAFVALAVTNTFRNFPEMVCSGCFEVQVFVFTVCVAFNLLRCEYLGICCSFTLFTLSPLWGSLLWGISSEFGFGRVEGRMDLQSDGGFSVCHALHSHQHGFRAGVCESHGEDTLSPAFGPDSC